jgi:hypothetical protein
VGYKSNAYDKVNRAGKRARVYLCLGMDPVEQTRTALLDRFLQAQAVGVERSSGNGVVMILKVCVSNRVADAINPGPGGGGGARGRAGPRTSP